ncbi:MAG: hypothetical protein SOV71_08080 [Anaerovoracaceae bacterium]|nr:hypothetical protein [Bacillota bacterium]MDY2671487.1 hypothetical protein [Anaerovoracaceae bacterium]
MVIFKYLLIAVLVLPIFLLGMYMLNDIADYILGSRKSSGKKDKK